MALNLVELTWDLTDLIQAGQSVEVSLVPSTAVTDSTDDLVIVPVVHSVVSAGGTGSLSGIVATDNPTLLPSGWWYTVTVTQYGGIGSVLVPPTNIYLAFTLGSVQDLSDVLAVPVVEPMQQYLPLPQNLPVAGYVPQATGVGEASEWVTPAAASLPLTTHGDIVFENSTPLPARLPGNTTATRKFLRQQGTGSASADPAWDTLLAADIPALSYLPTSDLGLPLALTGATAATRYAGGTTSGAPGSGTFAKGDFVIDQTGKIWVCTVAGSPGTWAAGAVIDATTGDIAAAPGTAAAGSVGLAADAGHVHPQPPMFAPTGLTGATAATRYVGATASGHPSSGTFAVGDFVIDQTGTVWICTVAGSPGTWTQVSGGGGPQGLWQPSVNGMLAATMDMDVALNYAAGTFGANPLTGDLYLVQLLTSKSVTFSTLWAFQVVAATSPTYMAMGVYSMSTGNRLAATSDQSGTGWTAFQSGVSLSGSVTASPASGVWIGILCVASSGPGTIGGGYPHTGPGVLPNLNLSAASYRLATNGSGLSTLPGSITPASNGTFPAPVLPWIGVS